MGHLGAFATPITMATPHTQTTLEHDDPLTLNEYGLPELRNSLQCAPVAGQSPQGIMPAFSDYLALNFGHGQAFSAAFESPQVGAMPALKTNFQAHRGSVGNMSEENISGGGSAHPHRLSIESATNYGQDGENASPDSAPALGLLAIGDALNDGSALGLTMDDTGSADGAEGSTTSKKDKEGTHDPPPWSEMKTKAGKERKRLPLACIACRRKKIRCSGEKPACKHCLRSRIPCVYKVTTRKAAPRTDYMAMLDKRLKRMEDRVVKLIPKESLPSISGVGRSVVKPALPGAPPKTPTTKKRAAEEAFGNELDEWAKSKTANPDMPSSSNSKESDETRLMTEGAESLPSREIQEHLAEVYFDFVYGQSYPLLHKPTFMKKLVRGGLPPVLILAICAIAARFSTHPQLRSEPAFLRGDKWAERARQIALKRYDTPNITILIVYLLLGLHEFGTCQGGRSWMFGGMAQRMAYALQLHKELEYDPAVSEAERRPLSITDREIRRRTMWSCFLMDRFNSSGTDRPLFVNEQYIEVQLPVKENLFIKEIQAPTENLDGNIPNPVAPDSGLPSNARENMGVSAYTIRLICIWGKIVKYMNLGGKEREKESMWSPKSTFLGIRKEARDFKDSLPEMLLYNSQNLKSHAVGKTANHFLYLHILYQQIMLFMHRFAFPTRADSRPPKDVPRDFLTESARIALDAANQISILINEAMDYNVVAPFAGYSAFFSSTVHVHGVFSKNSKIEAQSKKYLAYNVKYLSKMKKYWGMFHYIAENLKELYRQHADAQLRGPNATGDKSGKANIFQYGDWFDRYPHGVSKTDYEDAAEGTANEPGTDAVLGQKSDLQSVEEFFASLSPPSKAEQQRKQARKNKSKSVSKSDAPSTNHVGTPQAQQQARQMHASHLQQQMNHIHIAPQDAMDAAAFDPAYFNQATAQQQYIAEFQHQHQHPPPLPVLSTSPTSLMPHQMDLSPFPDLSAHPSNAAFWNLDPMSIGGANGFYDTSNAWFLPFNMEPPVLGDDGGTFGGGGEAYNFGLGPPTPMDLGLNGHAPHVHRQSVGHSQGGGINMEGLEGLDGR
jgi:hypothetical protein